MLYGRLAECAIAAVSRLAEVYDAGATRLSAERLADDRGLAQPTVSKVLASLSIAGIVEGRRGPGGGFWLARPPHEIRIHDVWSIFDRESEHRICPFGGGICGQDANCPIHEETAAARAAVDRLLHETTFEKFRAAAQEHGWRSQRPERLD